MPRWVPTSFTAGWKIRLEGVVYQIGATIPNPVVARVNKLSAYLSKRMIIPSPDPHRRRTTPKTPTPTALNPSEVRKIAGS